MKKLMLVIVMALGTGAAVSAQEKNEKATVPAAVKSAFEKQYPGNKVKWDNENGKFEAGFEYKGHEMSILYNANGGVEETEMEIKTVELPVSVKNYVAQNFKGQKIKEAAKITRSNGTVEYEAEVNGKDLIFSSNGSFVKETKD